MISPLPSPDFIIGTPKSKSAELRKEKSAENADLRRGIKKVLGVFFNDSFIFKTLFSEI